MAHLPAPYGLEEQTKRGWQGSSLTPETQPKGISPPWPDTGSVRPECRGKFRCEGAPEGLAKTADCYPAHWGLLQYSQNSVILRHLARAPSQRSQRGWRCCAFIIQCCVPEMCIALWWDRVYVLKGSVGFLSAENCRTGFCRCVFVLFLFLFVCRNGV